MDNIKTYERMAKLNLPENEREKISARAKEIINSFEALNAVDTEGVAPLFTVLNVQNVLREDTAAKFVSRETLLANAPEGNDGYFKVPKTI